MNGTITAKLYSISIPFKFTISHAAHSRKSCDSYILQLSDGEHTGYGEILIREYVSGVPESGEPLIDAIGKILYGRLSVVQKKSWENVKAYLQEAEIERNERPILCGLETALMELECRRRKCDIYDLLDRQPLRQTVQYGAILPFMPMKNAQALLQQVVDGEIKSIRVKLSKDKSYNRDVLSLSRRILGDDFDILVDANSAWDLERALEMLALCREFGVFCVEDPAKSRDMPLLADSDAAKDFCFLADESFCTEKDLEEIAHANTHQMLNIRLAKNGGILRCLNMAERAEELNLKYMLGCHVGETGILSFVGRAAAVLMAEPKHVSGSYDSILLLDNVTEENCDFGAGGIGSIFRGKALGYTVELEKLYKYTKDNREYQGNQWIIN
jgi:muconate cycloisomerase